jgi:hypothetical protein
MADDAAIASGEYDATRSRRRAFVEIAIAYGLILLVIWTPRPVQSKLWWVAAASVVVISAISWDGVDAMGLRRKNFFRSLWISGAALAVAVVACVVAARLHTLRLFGGPIWLIKNYWLYAVWSGVQQYLLQCFFLLRILRFVPNKRLAAFAAAGIFALAHLPNPILVSATIVWGFVACLVFLRYRNLYPLAIAHAILGITIAVTIPGTVDHNMRVGFGYLTYNPHRLYSHTHWPHRSSQP